MKAPLSAPGNGPKNGKEIHQLVAGFALGDAISNESLALRDLLRSWGFKSDIFSHHIKKEDVEHCRWLKELSPRSSAALIYHYSIAADEATRHFLKARGRKALLYHNITPEHFFAPYKALNPFIAKAYEYCKRGRAELPGLRDAAELSMADSAYNARELEDLGFKDVSVLPIMFDHEPFKAIAPDPELMRDLAGTTNFLFTGRVAPNKCQEDVIRAFAWYHRHIDPKSRLVLVGRESGAEYLDDVRSVAYSLGVSSHVLFTGHVSPEELAACYKSAHVFVCMSEHEGFCVPLLEAFVHDVPVLAYHSTGVPSTLGDAGILFRRKDFPMIAEAANLVISDPALRESLLRKQRRRLEDFHPARIAEEFKRRVERLTS